MAKQQDKKQHDRKNYPAKPIVQGFLVGLANTVPGLSGGTLLVMLGIFEKTIDAFRKILQLDKSWSRRFAFLCLLAFGVLLGILSVAKLLTIWMTYHMASVMALFFGLVLASAPELIKRYSSWKGLFGFVAGLAILWAFEHVGALSSPDAVIVLVCVGAIAAVAMLLPGLSGSLMLLSLGVYPRVMEAVGAMDLSILIPLGFGVALGLILGSWCIKVLLDRYPKTMGGLILGLVLGGMWVLFPLRWIAGGEEGLMQYVQILICIVFAALGYASWRFLRLARD